MKLNTKHFGEIDIDEEGILEFEEGIPGFESAKKYVLLGTEDEESPFRWLQSVDKPELAFAVIDPFAIKDDYNVEISGEIINKLGIEKAEEMLVYSIVVVPEDMTKMSMNLKAPVIINTSNKKGAQVVLDTDTYAVRHYILDELNRQRKDI